MTAPTAADMAGLLPAVDLADLADGARLFLVDLEARDEAFIGRGLAATVRLTVDGEAEAEYSLSRLDGDGRAAALAAGEAGPWGVDSTFGRDREGGLSVPVHCNGFGSLGCTRRRLPATAEAFLDSAAAAWSEAGRPPYRSAAYAAWSEAWALEADLFEALAREARNGQGFFGYASATVAEALRTIGHEAAALVAETGGK